MNPDWISFLQANGARLTAEQHITFPTESESSAAENTLYPIAHLTAFNVAGADAESFLQGQLTCNIKDLDLNRASLAAFCNAKGRVISTLLVCKTENTFIIILPQSLLNKVMNKLRMYILRAKVQLQDMSDRICLLGLVSAAPSVNDIPLPQQPYAIEQNRLNLMRLPGNSPRYLAYGTIDQAKTFWSQTVGPKMLPAGNSSDWIYQDLSAGIPWFDEAVSEEYIPQMLNIDKLGGISFNKGCYTGQEIIARTHYLGKTKRELFLAECRKTAMISADTTIIDRTSKESVGKIVAIARHDQSCRLLLVIQPEKINPEALVLNNSDQDRIDIIPFQ